MSELTCSNCKSYSLLNGFCKQLGVNKQPNSCCSEYTKFKDKCEDCDCDSCDGNCDCDGDCKETKSSSGGCTGCPSKCISLSVGADIEIDSVPVNKSQTIIWSYLLENGQDKEMGSFRVNNNDDSIACIHDISATVGEILCINLYATVRDNKIILMVENKYSCTEITIKRKIL